MRFLQVRVPNQLLPEGRMRQSIRSICPSSMDAPVRAIDRAIASYPRAGGASANGCHQWCEVFLSTSSPCVKDALPSIMIPSSLLKKILHTLAMGVRE
jgi:hypothetical protein